MRGPVITRRKFVAAGLGAAGTIAAGGSEAWSRPRRWLASGRRPLRAPGSLPRPFEPVGTPGAPREIDTAVVLMLENHSFDNILGLLPYRVKSRREVDGLPGNGRVPLASNPDSAGYPAASTGTASAFRSL